MAAIEEKLTVGKKVNNFLDKNRSKLLVVLILCICFVVGFVIGSLISSNSKEKKLAEIEQITYELTNESADLEESEINKRIDDALAKLSAFTNKGGIVGVRANLLYADLLYKQGKFADAIPYFEKVASLKSKAYTAPLALYNAAVCYEETGNVEKACELYKQVSENKDFFLMAHAKFSYGRILESQGKYKEAVEVYTELNDALPFDTWSNLAKTRILDLQISGKVE